MQQDRIKTTEFVVQKTGERMERVQAVRRRLRQRRELLESAAAARSMWLKIAICALALMIVIAVEVFLLSGRNGKIVAALGTSEDSGSDTDGEVLGRLQFVSADAAQSVFSVNQRWTSPVAATEASLLPGGSVLSLKANAGDRVSVPAGGEVREIFEDPAYGTAVRISHGNGLESVYYGIADIRVEVGQPLLALDTLGVMPDTSTIYVTISQSGSSMDPTDYIDTSTGY